MHERVILPCAVPVPQPDAWLIAHGYKREIRWKNPPSQLILGGIFLLHATIRDPILTLRADPGYLKKFGYHGDIPVDMFLHRGGIVGCARIKSFERDPIDQTQYIWHLERVQSLPFSPCMGNAGIIRPPVSVLKNLAPLIDE